MFTNIKQWLFGAILKSPTTENLKKNMRVGNSGYKGVSKASKTNNFEAYLSVQHGKKTIKMHIGTFPTVSEAHTARLKFIDKLK